MSPYALSSTGIPPDLDDVLQQIGLSLPHIAHEVATTRAAQKVWADTPLERRLQVIKRARHEIAANARQLATAVEMPGRTQGDTLAAEVLPLADACRFLVREAPALLAPRLLNGRSRPFWLHNNEVEIHREPLGVVLIIGPSNYPLFLPGVQLLQALVAGNTVLLKPGKGGAKAATALADVLQRAGLGSHRLRVLPEATEAALAVIHVGVDHVIITGSAHTGATLLAELAPGLTPATLELSGCDAAFIHADADLDLVARALAFSLRLNGGATCIAPRRVFVSHTLSKPLEARLRALLEDLPPQPVTGHAARMVTEALAQGARLVVGQASSDMFVAPLVLADTSPDMRLLQEDVMAPVLSLISVRDDEQALTAAALCPYALGATIFGAEKKARALAPRLRAGVVVINDVIVPTADPRLPFGGRGRSGYGVTRGAEGLLALTAVKAVALRRGRWRPHFDSTDHRDANLFQAYIAAAHGATLRQRASACWALLRGVAAKARRRQGGDA